MYDTDPALLISQEPVIGDGTLEMAVAAANPSVDPDIVTLCPIEIIPSTILGN